jgi:hypothetical protein
MALNMNKRINLILTGYLFLFCTNAFSQQIIDSTRIFGVTIDNPFLNIPGIKTALSSHCIKPTARIVFDEFVAATDYIGPVTQIKTSGFIMGELVDSYYFDQYSVKQYKDRTKEYCDTLGNLVDIWEIGNEVNGEWLGNINDVIDKISGAYNIIKPTGKKTAITLYFNRNCYSDPQNEMFTWINHRLPNSMKKGLDYVFVSYYEDDCNNTILSQSEWQQVFDSLHVIFPNSKLGIGECGTATTYKKAEYMKRYYGMKINTQNYVEGNFWWYYKQDCVPKTRILWSTLNDIVCNVTTDNRDMQALSDDSFKVYPSPASDKITIELPQDVGEGILTICDIEGREVIKQLVKSDIAQIDISMLKNGVYIIMLTSARTVEVTKIIKE